ncbi:MAG: hypothetical protein PUF72_02895 [Clostridiales bacterium]|nr:hypothetical protein [Clostridiales bacterium]
MADINEQIQNDLKELGFDPIYAYPKTISQMPAVCFYCLSKTSVYSFLKCEYVIGYVQIDVYSNKKTEPAKTADKIQTGLYDRGWICEQSMCIPDGDKDYYRVTMRLRKIFDDKE